MASRLFRPWHPPHSSRLGACQAFYHDYVRYPTPSAIQLGGRFLYSSHDLGGSVRIPLSSSRVIGVANSRGERE